MNKNGRRRFFKFFPLRLVSAFVLTTFISTNQFAAPALAVPAAPAIINEILPTDPAAIKVPQEIGNIQEVFSATPPNSVGRMRPLAQKMADPSFGGKGRNEKTVFLIQDAHSIPDAQRSIQRLIEYFEAQYGINRVALEGASSSLDPQIFRSFPDQKLLKRVFEEYREAGELAGGPAAAIFSPHNASYFGIEDWDLYEEGIRLYQEALSKEQELTSLLTSIESNLLDQSKTLFSPNTQKLQDKKTSFQKNEIDLIEYVKSLKDLFEKTTRDSIAAPFKVGARHAVPLQRGALSIEKNTFKTFHHTYPELHKILFAESNEKTVKRETFDSAQTQLIQTFKETLLPKLPKQKQIEMNQMIQLHNIGHLSQGMLVKRIEDLSREFNFTFRTPEVLKPAVTQARTLESIKGTKLFEELETLEETLRNALPQTNEERTLLNDFHHLELLKRLARLELTRKDWRLIAEDGMRNEEWERAADPRKAKSESRISKLETNPNVRTTESSKRLGHSGIGAFDIVSDFGFRYSDLLKTRHSELRTLLSPHLAFYRLASQRDTALFNNLLKFLNRSPRHPTPDTCLPAGCWAGHLPHGTILVTGGFHSESLAAKLKEQNISYLLIAPRMDSIPAETQYRNHMRGEVSWKDYFEVENGKVNLYNAFVRAARDRLLNNSKFKTSAKHRGGSDTHFGGQNSKLLKPWRDQIIRDLADQNRIEDSSRYTRFLDELSPNHQSPFTVHRSLFSRLEGFIQGLERLEAGRQLTKENVLKLFQPATTADSTYSVLDSKPEIRASLLGLSDKAAPLSLRSETRAGDAGAREQASRKPEAKREKRESKKPAAEEKEPAAQRAIPTVPTEPKSEPVSSNYRGPSLEPSLVSPIRKGNFSLKKILEEIRRYANRLKWPESLENLNDPSYRPRIPQLRLLHEALKLFRSLRDIDVKDSDVWNRYVAPYADPEEPVASHLALRMNFGELEELLNQAIAKKDAKIVVLEAYDLATLSSKLKNAAREEILKDSKRRQDKHGYGATSAWHMDVLIEGSTIYITQRLLDAIMGDRDPWLDAEKALYLTDEMKELLENRFGDTYRFGEALELDDAEKRAVSEGDPGAQVLETAVRIYNRRRGYPPERIALGVLMHALFRMAHPDPRRKSEGDRIERGFDPVRVARKADDMLTDYMPDFGKISDIFRVTWTSENNEPDKAKVRAVVIDATAKVREQAARAADNKFNRVMETGFFLWRWVKRFFKRAARIPLIRRYSSQLNETLIQAVNDWPNAAVTDPDLLDEFRRKFHTPESPYEYIRSAGGTLASIATRFQAGMWHRWRETRPTPLRLTNAQRLAIQNLFIAYIQSSGTQDDERAFDLGLHPILQEIRAGLGERVRVLGSNLMLGAREARTHYRRRHANLNRLTPSMIELEIGFATPRDVDVSVPGVGRGRWNQFSESVSRGLQRLPVARLFTSPLVVAVSLSLAATAAQVFVMRRLNQAAVETGPFLDFIFPLLGPVSLISLALVAGVVAFKAAIRQNSEMWFARRTREVDSSLQIRVSRPTPFAERLRLALVPKMNVERAFDDLFHLYRNRHRPLSSARLESLLGEILARWHYGRIYGIELFEYPVRGSIQVSIGRVLGGFTPYNVDEEFAKTRLLSGVNWVMQDLHLQSRERDLREEAYPEILNQIQASNEAFRREKNRAVRIAAATAGALAAMSSVAIGLLFRELVEWTGWAERMPVTSRNSLYDFLEEHPGEINRAQLKTFLEARGIASPKEVIEEFFPHGEDFDRTALVRRLLTQSDPKLTGALEEFLEWTFGVELKFSPWSEPAFLKDLWNVPGLETSLSKALGRSGLAFDEFRTQFEAQMLDPEHGPSVFYNTLEEILGSDRAAKQVQTILFDGMSRMPEIMNQLNDLLRQKNFLKTEGQIESFFDRAGEIASSLRRYENYVIDPKKFKTFTKAAWNLRKEWIGEQAAHPDWSARGEQLKSLIKKMLNRVDALDLTSDVSEFRRFEGFNVRAVSGAPTNDFLRIFSTSSRVLKVAVLLTLPFWLGPALAAALWRKLGVWMRPGDRLPRSERTQGIQISEPHSSRPRSELREESDRDIRDDLEKTLEPWIRRDKNTAQRFTDWLSQRDSKYQKSFQDGLRRVLAKGAGLAAAFQIRGISVKELNPIVKVIADYEHTQSRAEVRGEIGHESRHVSRDMSQESHDTGLMTHDSSTPALSSRSEVRGKGEAAAGNQRAVEKINVRGGAGVDPTSQFINGVNVFPDSGQFQREQGLLPLQSKSRQLPSLINPPLAHPSWRIGDPTKSSSKSPQRLKGATEKQSLRKSLLPPLPQAGQSTSSGRNSQATSVTPLLGTFSSQESIYPTSNDASIPTETRSEARREEAWQNAVTDPNHHNKNSFRYFVHALQAPEVRKVRDKGILDLQKKGRVKEAAEGRSIDLTLEPDRISEKPVISTSYLDQDHRGTWGWTGFILEVPSENIIATYTRDGRTPYWEGLDWVKAQLQNRETLLDPATLLQLTSPYGYNEALVTGRHPADSSKRVKIKGVFINTAPSPRMFPDSMQDTIHLLKAQAEKNNWPVIYIEILRSEARSQINAVDLLTDDIEIPTEAVGIVAYHGKTTNAEKSREDTYPETFGTGLYLTSRNSAEDYARVRAKQRGGGAAVERYRLDRIRLLTLKNNRLPSDLEAAWRKRLLELNRESDEKRVIGTTSAAIEKPSGSHLTELQRGLQEELSHFLQEKGYDGLVAQEGGEKEIGRHVTIVVFDRNKAKLIQSDILRSELRKALEEREVNRETSAGAEDVLWQAGLVNHPVQQPARKLSVSGINGNQSPLSADSTFPLLVGPNLPLQDKSASLEDGDEFLTSEQESRQLGGWRNAVGRSAPEKVVRFSQGGEGNGEVLQANKPDSSLTTREAALAGEISRTHFQGLSSPDNFGGTPAFSGELPPGSRLGRPSLIPDTGQYNDRLPDGRNSVTELGNSAFLTSEGKVALPFAAVKGGAEESTSRSETRGETVETDEGRRALLRDRLINEETGIKTIKKDNKIKFFTRAGTQGRIQFTLGTSEITGRTITATLSTGLPINSGVKVEWFYDEAKNQDFVRTSGLDAGNQPVVRIFGFRKYKSDPQFSVLYHLEDGAAETPQAEPEPKPEAPTQFESESKIKAIVDIVANLERKIGITQADLDGLNQSLEKDRSAVVEAEKSENDLKAKIESLAGFIETAAQFAEQAQNYAEAQNAVNTRALELEEANKAIQSLKDEMGKLDRRRQKFTRLFKKTLDSAKGTREAYKMHGDEIEKDLSPLKDRYAEAERAQERASEAQEESNKQLSAIEGSLGEARRTLDTKRERLLSLGLAEPNLDTAADLEAQRTQLSQKLEEARAQLQAAREKVLALEAKAKQYHNRLASLEERRQKWLQKLEPQAAQEPPVETPVDMPEPPPAAPPSPQASVKPNLEFIDLPFVEYVVQHVAATPLEKGLEDPNVLLGYVVDSIITLAGEESRLRANDVKSHLVKRLGLDEEWFGRSLKDDKMSKKRTAQEAVDELDFDDFMIHVYDYLSEHPEETLSKAFASAIQSHAAETSAGEQIVTERAHMVLEDYAYQQLWLPPVPDNYESFVSRIATSLSFTAEHDVGSFLSENGLNPDRFHELLGKEDAPVVLPEAPASPQATEVKYQILFLTSKTERWLDEDDLLKNFRDDVNKNLEEFLKNPEGKRFQQVKKLGSLTESVGKKMVLSPPYVFRAGAQPLVKAAFKEPVAPASAWNTSGVITATKKQPFKQRNTFSAKMLQYLPDPIYPQILTTRQKLFQIKRIPFEIGGADKRLYARFLPKERTVVVLSFVTKGETTTGNGEKSGELKPDFEKYLAKFGDYKSIAEFTEADYNLGEFEEISIKRGKAVDQESGRSEMRAKEVNRESWIVNGEGKKRFTINDTRSTEKFRSELHEVARQIVGFFIHPETVDSKEVDTVTEKVIETLNAMPAAEFGNTLRAEAGALLNEIEKSQKAPSAVSVDKDLAAEAIERFTNALAAGKVSDNLAVAFDTEVNQSLLDALKKMKGKIGVAFFDKKMAKGLNQKTLKNLSLTVQVVGDLNRYRPSQAPAAQNPEAVPVVNDTLAGNYLIQNGALFGVGVNQANVPGEPYLEVVEKVVQIVSGLVVAERIKKPSDLRNPAKLQEIQAELLKRLFEDQVPGVLAFRGDGNLVISRPLLQKFVTKYLARAEIRKAA